MFVIVIVREFNTFLIVYIYLGAIAKRLIDNTRYFKIGHRVSTENFVARLVPEKQIFVRAPVGLELDHKRSKTVNRLIF